MWVEPLLVALIVAVLILWAWSSRRDAARARLADAHYLTEGALADDYADGGRAFELRVPPGPAVDVMLRYTAEGLTDGHRTGSVVHYGLKAVIEVTREPEGNTYREAATPFTLHRECVTGVFPRDRSAERQPFLAKMYASTFTQRTVTETALLAEVPAGGVMIVRGRVEPAPGTTPLALTVFAKPTPPSRPS